VDERVIFESCHHEEGRVHAVRDVARQDGVANVPSPDWQTWLSPSSRSLPLTTVHLVFACKHALASLHLVIEVHDAGEARKPADDIDEQFAARGQTAALTGNEDVHGRLAQRV